MEDILYDGMRSYFGGHMSGKGLQIITSTKDTPKEYKWDPNDIVASYDKNDKELPSVEYIKTAGKTPFMSFMFNYVYMVNILHKEDLVSVVLRECGRILRKGGTIGIVSSLADVAGKTSLGELISSLADYELSSDLILVELGIIDNNTVIIVMKKKGSAVNVEGVIRAKLSNRGEHYHVKELVLYPDMDIEKRVLKWDHWALGGKWDLVADWIINAFHPKTALDIQAGKGPLVHTLRTQSVTAYGCEVDEYCIANPIVPNCVADGHLIGGTVFSQELKKKMDLVTCFNFLNQIPSDCITKTVKQIYSLMKKDAILIITVPTDPNLYRIRSSLSPSMEWYTVAPRKYWETKVMSCGFVTETISQSFLDEMINPYRHSDSSRMVVLGFRRG